CFHAEGSAAAAAFVTDRLRMLLQGRIGYLMGGLRQMGTTHPLGAAQARALQSVRGDVENNRAHLAYDPYVAPGYPIGRSAAAAEGELPPDHVAGNLRKTLRNTAALASHPPTASPCPGRPLTLCSAHDGAICADNQRGSGAAGRVEPPSLASGPARFDGVAGL